MTLLLEAHQLRKRFATIQALDGVDLVLDRCHVVGLLGANGAGKSTTMKIIAGHLAPSAGRVVIDGHDQSEDPLACRRLIGYLPQDLPLYGEMRVTAYLDHVARLKGITATARRHEVWRVMERCALTGVERRHIHKLSGGNRQRVGLAQALLGAPPLLILDEATAGLDPAQVANFRDMIRELSDDHAIVLSTHILAEVERCCDRAVMIDNGRTVLDEPVGVLQRRAHQICRALLRCRAPAKAMETALEAAPWVRSFTRHGEQTWSIDLDDDARDRLLPLALDLGPVDEFSPEKRSLEEVFRDLIAKTADQGISPQAG